MPLSEHEQRLLDQIERALYAEDPKFASNVRGGRLHRPSRRRRIQGIAGFSLGLILLVVGMIAPVRLADIPVVSVVGFLVMFAGAVIVLSSMRGGGEDSESESREESGTGGTGGTGGSGGSRKKPEARRSSFTQRMEDRFRKRFDQ